MNKKIIPRWFLVFLTLGIGSIKTVQACSSCVTIESKELELLDGTTLLEIEDLVLAVIKLKQLRVGKGKQKEGLFKVSGKKYTLSSLVSCESESSCGFKSNEVHNSLR